MRWEYAHPRRGELNGQGESIEAVTDLRDGRSRRVVDGEVGLDRLRPGDEEPHRLVLGELRERGWRLAPWQGQRGHRILPLRLQMEWGATGREHRQAWCCSQEFAQHRSPVKQ